MAGRKLFRTSNARLCGVCAGIANRLKIDPVIVRIVFVAGTLLTGGVLAVAYIALALVLPKRDSSEVMDVTPEAASSERFGPIDCKSYCAARSKAAGAAQGASGLASQSAEPSSGGGASGSQAVGLGHLPPEPPRSFTRR